ncbi:MAG: beta-galactosidase [Clostridia bacterium]|nr:beta-galactosidase [Clostridia bacterium]
MKKRMNRIFAMVLAASALFTVVPAMGVGAATNTVPAGWSFGMSANTVGGVTVDTTEKYGGEASMKLWNHTRRTKEEYVRISYDIPVEPGHAYKYGFMAKVENGNGNIYCQMNWDRSALTNLVPTGKTADWRSFEFVYNNGAETSAAIRFCMENYTDGLWIDDMYFYDMSLPQTPENNLIKNPSFEGIATQAASGEASQDIVPVHKKKDIVIDGSLDEWKDVTARTLDIYTDFTKEAQSIAGEIRYAYDDDNFYFLLDVEDDAHMPISAGSYWNGDGLQFTICGTDETFGISYGVVYDEKSNLTVEFGDTAIITSTTRKGNHTVYEVAIPWSAYFGEIPPVVLFCAIANDNDDDGKGRKGCIDVAPGISMYKGSQAFPKMMLLKDEDEFATFFQGDKDISTGGIANYTVDLFNQTEREKTFTISSEKAGVKEKVTIQGGQSGSFHFSAELTGYGETEVDVSVTDGKVTVSDTMITNVCADEAITVAVIAQQKKQFNELTALIGECIEKGIPIEYQKVKYYTIELFIQYLEEDLADKDLTRIAHQDKVLTRLYNEAKAELEGLLAGTIQPVSVPRYVTSPIEVVDNHFVATTQREDGTKEERPVFFVGAGHWEPSRQADVIETLSKVGFNCSHPELGPWDIMTEAIPVKNWSLRGVGNYEVEVSASDEVRNGQSALKIVSTAPYRSNNYKYLIQTVDAKPNTTYEYGISVKGSNVLGAFYILTTNGLTGVGNRAMRQSLNGTFDWRDDKLSYTTGPEEKTLSFIILVEDKAGAIIVDDAFIRQAGTDQNLLLNGNFEGRYPEGQYYAIDERTVKKFEETFDNLAKFNLSGQFGASPHYVPSFVLRDYPEINLPEQWGNFNHQDPNHPKLLEMYEIFYKSLIPRIKDKESFDGVILANEPQYNSMLDSWAFMDDYRAAMKEKYKNIQALNQRWGTAYKSFDEVEMPNGIEATPRYYDWKEYNDTILPEWIGNVSDYIKAIDPDVFTHVKVMDTFKTGVNFRISSSDNYEILKDVTDINGCDAWSMIATDDSRWKNIFYDFLTSVKNAPIYNTEDHIIVDARTLTYDDNEVLYNIADIWNGAVHGRGGSVLWLWDRYSRSKNGTIYFNSLLTARPDSVATLGKTTLDLNRLAKEVVALQDAKSEIAVLYSDTSVPYNDEMLDIIRSVSASLGENGQKTRFVVESQLGTMMDYKAIIIPGSVSVRKDTLEQLNRFVQQGGELIILGDKALSLNEYGDKHSERLVSAVKSKAVCLTYEDAGTTIAGVSKQTIKKAITTLVQELKLDTVVVKDKATGETVTDADWITAEYDGAYIINLCGYTWEDREVEVYLNGQKVTASEDLINFGKYGETITLEGHVPLLLRVEK